GGVAPVEFMVRQGALNGLLLDRSGKPAPNVDIMMLPSSAPMAGIVNTSKLVMEADGPPQPDANSVSWERIPVARTGPDGRFIIHPVPWGAARIVLRATSGSDRAEFSGAVSGIGDLVTLRMTPNALITVTGRLIDAQRRPVSGAACRALHWQPTLRSFWFASAHELTSDGQGRFRVAGLERGESFSVISGASGVPMQQAVIVRSQAVRKAGAKGSPITAFESPRFTAAREGAVQNLGDVMVHPSTTPDEVLQSYGAVRREIVSTGVIEAPDAAKVQQAAAALGRYEQAIAEADPRAAQILTSRLSPTWAPALPDYLIRCSFVQTSEDGAGVGPLRAMRFVPRALLQSMTAGSAAPSAGPGAEVRTNSDLTDLQVQATSFDGGRRSSFEPLNSASAITRTSRALGAAGSWVLFTRDGRNGPVFAGLTHWENGKWRVASGTVAPGTPLAALSFFFGGVAPTRALAARNAAPLSIGELVAARDAGARFLRDWAENRPDAMLRRTARVSLAHTARLADYRRQQERRVDQGNCPLNAGDKVSLQPLPGLNAWERRWLSVTAWSHGQTTEAGAFDSTAFLRAAFDRSDVTESAPTRRLRTDRRGARSRANATQRGRSVLLQYEAAGGRFLMALVYEKGAWRVVEPAMPM
ncbi:MAG TPA: hypothetical protein VKT77_10950, partial [Chthonomonadaceae bacterium]|nr:hypothetical protein [Chthonomonadaceae bacterium]